MNPTERKAHEWLLAHGAKKITYQGRKSPDFITDIGNFEVKRLYGETVLFTQLQIPMLSSNNHCEYEGCPNYGASLEEGDLDEW